MGNTAGFKVLIVEDDLTHQLLIRRALEAAGDRFSLVHLVETAEDARHVAQQLEFDAILVDNRIPGARGLDLIAEFHGEGLRAPCVLMTASGSEDLVVRAHRSAVADYVVKDGDFWRDVPRLLERVIDVHRAEVAHQERHAQLERTNTKLDNLNTDVQLENQQLRHTNDALSHDHRALLERFRDLKHATDALVSATEGKGIKLTARAKAARGVLLALQQQHAQPLSSPPDSPDKTIPTETAEVDDVTQQATG